jgi:hypothetical protein
MTTIAISVGSGEGGEDGARGGGEEYISNIQQLMKKF